MPIAVMTYYNIVYRAGHRRMARCLVTAGVSGAIVPDLSLEELDPWAVEADAAGVDTVLLVAPSSPEERVARICPRARGFVYAVSRMSVTGERQDLGGEAANVVERVRRHTDLPVCVGVGVSTPSRPQRSARSPMASSWVRLWCVASSKAKAPKAQPPSWIPAPSDRLSAASERPFDYDREGALPGGCRMCGAPHVVGE